MKRLPPSLLTEFIQTFNETFLGWMFSQAPLEHQLLSPPQWEMQAPQQSFSPASPVLDPQKVNSVVNENPDPILL